MKHRDNFFRRGGDVLKRGRILRQPVHGAGFAGHTLYQHSDGHSTRKRVRVDDDVGLHPAL